MAVIRRATLPLMLITSGVLLASCITVEPTSNVGKAAVKTATVVKRITPSKPTMVIPASQRTYYTDAERDLACRKAGDKARLMVIDESGNANQRVISDVAIDCSLAPASLPSAAPQVVPAISTQPVYEPAPVYTTAQTPTHTYVQPEPAPAPQVLTASSPRTIRVAVGDGPEQVFEIDETGTARPTSGAYSQPQIYQASTTRARATYRVQRGDNIYRIAKNNCVSQDALADLNGLGYPYTISPGQVLTLPRGGC